MIRYILTVISAVFLINLSATAQYLPDSALLNRYTRLFALMDPDSVDAFYEVSAQICDGYKQANDTVSYYMKLTNEIKYDAGRGRYFLALKKANAVMEEAKDGDDVPWEYYTFGYRAMGIIFHNMGNFQMANKYYEQALNSIDYENTGHLSKYPRYVTSNTYISLADVNILQNPRKAWEWNELLRQYFERMPIFEQQYLAHKAQIYFFAGQRDSFLVTKREYDEFMRKPLKIKLYYGERKLRAMDYIVNGRTNEALLLIDSIMSEDPTERYFTIHLYKAAGQNDLALDNALKWIAQQDSLNNELVSENLNELNVTMGMTKLQEEAARKQKTAMAIIIVLLVLALVLLAWRYVTRRRLQRQIIDKNQQLEIALDEAQESDRMKTAFIQHVSHEMRTPLNIITGNVQLIANPDFDIAPDDRQQLLTAIDENTHNITTIINDLLEMSLQGSKQHYRLDDDVDVNQLCRQALDQAIQKNNGRLQLNFDTTIADGYTLHTSRQALERILHQLLSNALKFTPDGGTIWLTAQLTADGHTIEIAVADTGIGIAPEYHEKAFEEFFKVDSFRQGMGVGLTVARKTATALGGSLAIDSAYTDGARFVLLMPVGK